MMVFTIIVLISLFISFLTAYPVMWLWNWIVPNVMNGPKIDVWMAWGIMWLISLLFGSKSRKSD